MWDLLEKETGMSNHALTVKADFRFITETMIRDGEIMGEIDQINDSFIFKGLVKKYD